MANDKKDAGMMSLTDADLEAVIGGESYTQGKNKYKAICPVCKRTVYGMSINEMITHLTGAHFAELCKGSEGYAALHEAINQMADTLTECED